VPVGRIWLVVQGTRSVSGQSVTVEGHSKTVTVSVVYNNITHTLDIRKKESRTYDLLGNIVINMFVLLHVVFFNSCLVPWVQRFGKSVSPRTLLLFF
jgi:hypothetical protein